MSQNTRLFAARLKWSVGRQLFCIWNFWNQIKNSQGLDFIFRLSLLLFSQFSAHFLLICGEMFSVICWYQQKMNGNSSCNVTKLSDSRFPRFCLLTFQFWNKEHQRPNNTWTITMWKVASAKPKTGNRRCHKIVQIHIFRVFVSWPFTISDQNVNIYKGKDREPTNDTKWKDHTSWCVRIRTGCNWGLSHCSENWSPPDNHLALNSGRRIKPH